MHCIAAKAVAFKEAMTEEFKQCQRQTVKNAMAMAQEFVKRGYTLVSGGTDNHLLLVDLTPICMTGKDAATVLEQAGIVVNKNVIPFEARSPFVTSGIRIGTPAATTRGMKEDEMRTIARMIVDVLKNPGDGATLSRVQGDVLALAAAFPPP